MAHEIAHISVRKLPVKILLILLLLAAGVWSYYVVRWYLGNEWWWRPILEGRYDGSRLGLTTVKQP